MSKHISTRSHIPAQSTTGAGTGIGPGAEDLPPNYAEILDEVKREVRTGYVRAQRAANTAMIAMYWRIGIVQQAAAQLPWGHTMLMLDKLEVTAKLDLYAAAALSNGWSRADLTQAIESKLLERKGLTAHNFPTTIPDRS
jgi:hypothetical protein